MPSCREANSSILPDVNRWMADSFSRVSVFWLIYEMPSVRSVRAFDALRLIELVHSIALPN